MAAFSASDIGRAALLRQRFEEGEAEGDQRAARRRRRIERYRGACVPPIKRLAALDAISPQIVGGEMPAKLARLRHHGLPDIAIAKQPRAVFGEPFKRLGQPLIAEGLARLEQPSLRREDARDAGARGKDRRDHREQIGLEVVRAENRRARRGPRAPRAAS